jgi:hypothetical protein
MLERGLRPTQRLPLLALGFIGLIVGVGTGLARLGWSVPDWIGSVSALHGPLLVGGFFGTVIALERAVAIGRHWPYLGPLLAGSGTVAAAAGAAPVSAWCLLAGSLVLLAASLVVFRRQSAMFTFTMALGAACWFVGNALWVVGSSTQEIVQWWLAFLILTIAGERLELSRLLPPSPVAKRMFAAIIAVICAGLLGGPWRWGPQLFAAGLLALSLWLLKQDIARRTVRSRGLTRFIAVCLLSGYAWLAIAGATMLLAGGLVPGSRSYDATLHAVFLGFVFSMVFGHAPIIFPAVVRVDMPYHPTFYAPLALLHASLLMRLLGDAMERFDWARIGGMLNAVALAAFIISTASAVVRGRRNAGAGASRA